ncbi:unnamed protein product [Sphagnum jensenii]|uniref:Signal recognition particle subunit SRP72 n=1 Tax=Sphagnum jensenii TaxID=128206 RepID=A0ABP0VYH7_9BRYO
MVKEKEEKPKDKEQLPLEKEGAWLDDLVALLDRSVRANDYKQIVKVADQILARAPGDAEAKECKVTALIQAGDISQALQTIESSQTPSLDFRFHKAYCLYRLNQLSEALAALNGVERSENVLQLEAQILYRKGEFGECISSYQKIFKEHKLNSTEIKTNIVAAYIARGRATEVSQLMESLKVSAHNGFEMAYNAACASIERKEFSKAEELLLLAHRIGQESLIEDDYTEEEIEDELAPISVQLAYVQQMQGCTEEAIESYNRVLKRKPVDALSVAIASNNLIAIRGGKDLFDSLKKSDKLLENKGLGQKLQFAEGLDHKLSTRQKEAISFNRCLLLLHSNKLSQARQFVSSLMETFPDSIIPTILSLAVTFKERKQAHVENVLDNYAAEHPKSATDASVVRAQATAAAGNFLEAAKSLEAIPELRHKPGMIATIVALREKGGDVQGAEIVLDNAVEYWRNHTGDDVRSTLETIIQEAAAFKLGHNKMKAAASMFEQLVSSSSTMVKMEALNGLVCSTAFSEPIKARSYEKQLPPLPGLSALNAEALERAAPTKRGRVGEDRVEATKTGDGKLDKVRPAKKRKRKPLYPKGFDPANPGPPPDPERCLPKRERSSFRPKKKDKKNAQIRGAQGSVTRDKSVDTGGANGNVSSIVTGPRPAADGKKGNSSISSEVTVPHPGTGSRKGKKKGRQQS